MLNSEADAELDTVDELEPLADADADWVEDEVVVLLEVDVMLEVIVVADVSLAV